MSAPRLLIIGNFSASCHVGAMLGRAAETLGLTWTRIDTGIQHYAPSLQTLPGRVFFRLSGGRPLEWWRFNRRALGTLSEARPQMVIVSGVLPLHPQVFATCQKLGARISNFATDDPWSCYLRHSTAFLRTIPLYDLIVSTKSRVVDDFHRCGARRVEWCTYAFDPYWHRLPDPVPDAERARFAADLSFVGTGNPARRIELEQLAAAVLGTHKLYGNDWEQQPPRGWKRMGEALDNTFRLAVHEAKLCLALLRKGSRDDSTQRTYEIAPCGGCGLYEDTSEHRMILKGYPEIGFFKTTADLAEICRHLLPDEAKRHELRDIGMKILVRPENTFAARLRSIIEWCDLGVHLPEQTSS